VVLAGVPRRRDSDDELAAPARARDLGGLPPALVALADHDPLHDEGADFARRLAAAGVDVETVAPPGMIHGFARLQETAARRRCSTPSPSRCDGGRRR